MENKNMGIPQFAPKLSEEEKIKKVKEIKTEKNEKGEKYVCVYLSSGEYYDDYSITEIENYIKDKYNNSLIFNKRVDPIIDKNNKVVAYKFFYQ